MINSEANVGDTAIGCLLDVMMIIVLAVVLPESMMISAMVWMLILSIPVWILRLVLYKSQSLDPWTARFLGPSFVVAAAVLAFIMPLEPEIFENDEETENPLYVSTATYTKLAPDRSRPDYSRRHYSSSISGEKWSPVHSHSRPQSRERIDPATGLAAAPDSEEREREIARRREKYRSTPTGRYRQTAGYKRPRSYTGGFGDTGEKPREDTVTLHDYTNEELAEMFRLHVRMAHFVLTPEADRLLLSHISSLVTKRDRRFGIERWVRAEFDAAARRQAERVAQMLNPSKDDLVTLTASDIGIRPAPSYSPY